MTKKFLRQDHMRFSKLGKRRKKLQKWRKPKGRDSKMRQKRRSYPKSPSVGFKKNLPVNQIIVHNISELSSADKNKKIILARVGAKKKLELIKKSQDLNIKLENIGVKK